MQQRGEGGELASDRTSIASEQTGRYTYCVARACERVTLGGIGIEGSQVYALAHNDLCVLVHDCLPQPYQSHDTQVVGAWVLAHHGVVEAS